MSAAQTITPLSLPGLLLVEPARVSDGRGFFSEVFRAETFEAAAGPHRFVQDNHSLSAARGTVRGLHFQHPPHAQGKLVRVVRGAILDVAVDVRIGSPTYGRHERVELSRENWRQIWVPPGFLHGFCTLEPDTEVLYKVTHPYSPGSEGAVRWNDPDLGIEWPVGEAEATLSDKDRRARPFREFASPFAFER